MGRCSSRNAAGWREARGTFVDGDFDVVGIIDEEDGSLWVNGADQLDALDILLATCLWICECSVID